MRLAHAHTRRGVVRAGRKDGGLARRGGGGGGTDGEGEGRRDIKKKNVAVPSIRVTISIAEGEVATAAVSTLATAVSPRGRHFVQQGVKEVVLSDHAASTHTQTRLNTDKLHRDYL